MRHIRKLHKRKPLFNTNLPYIIIVLLFILIFSVCIYKFINHPTINYYISSKGDDSNSGDKSSPLKSLNGFKDVLLRDLSNNTIKDNSKINLNISNGNYYFEKGFTLNNSELINKNITLNIIGDNKNKVIFTGGYKLDNDKFKSKLFSKIYTYDLSDVSLPSKSDLEKVNPEYPFCELSFNDTPLTIARYPNEGFLKTEDILSTDKNNYSFESSDTTPFKWNDIKKVSLSGYWYHDWASTIVNSISLNKEDESINIYDTLPYGIKENARYYLFNSLDALDAKGEYYIDYDKKLLYLIPPSSIGSEDIYLNLLNTPFITLNECKNVSIKNITFQNGVNNIISCNKSSNITIKDCIIKNSTKNALVINEGFSFKIESLHIYNMGEGGIILNGGNREKLISSNCTISDNEINNFSRIKRTYSPAINISGVGVKVSKNEIYDAPHNGIMFGGNDHIIEKNTIYDICKETNDVGAIYCGRDWTYRGNIIRDNSIYDLVSSAPGDWVVGIYLDDCFSSAHVYNNSLKNIPLGILAGGGRDNIIEKNTLTNCKRSISFDERGMKGANIAELEDRLKKVPYNSKLWTKKYPEIKSLDSTPHGIPYNNTIKDNKLKNSGDITLSENVVKYENKD